MIIRSALLVGSVSPEDQAAFDAYMKGEVVAEILTYPGIRGVTLRKTLAADGGAPPIYMQFDLAFESVAAMEAALASPTRQTVRTRIAQGMGPFKGHVAHIVQSVETP